MLPVGEGAEAVTDEDRGDPGRGNPGDESKLIKRAEAVAGYINFHVEPETYSGLVLESIIDLDKEYGFLKTDSPERVMVEHTSADPINTPGISASISHSRSPNRLRR